MLTSCPELCLPSSYWAFPLAVLGPSVGFTGYLVLRLSQASVHTYTHASVHPAPTTTDMPEM
jgi:hypothetical protein